MNWHLLISITFILVFFGGLGLGSIWHYYKYEQAKEEK